MLKLGFGPWQQAVLRTGGGGGIAVDLWQDFDFATLNTTNLAANDHCPDGTWTITEDTAGNMVTSTDAEKTSAGKINGTADSGTRGLRYDAPAAQEAGYLTYEFATTHATVSFGWWFRFPASFVGTFEFGQPDILNVINITDFNNEPYVKLFDNNAATIGLFTSNAGVSSTISVSPNTWYWITAFYGTTHRLRVYNEAGAQVGSEVTLPGSSTAAVSFRFVSLIGTIETVTDPFDHDDLVVAWTNPAFPLGPPV